MVEQNSHQEMILGGNGHTAKYNFQLLEQPLPQSCRLRPTEGGGKANLQFSFNNKKK